MRLLAPPTLNGYRSLARCVGTSNLGITAKSLPLVVVLAKPKSLPGFCPIVVAHLASHTSLLQYKIEFVLRYILSCLSRVSIDKPDKEYSIYYQRALETDENYLRTYKRVENAFVYPSFKKQF